MVLANSGFELLGGLLRHSLHVRVRRRSILFRGFEKSVFRKRFWCECGIWGLEMRCLAGCVCGLVLWISGAVLLADEDSVVRVFIFAGQSNMVGSDSKIADIGRFPPFAGLDQPQAAVRFSYCLGREEKLESAGWESLRPVYNVVGPELSFGREVTSG